jgi:hypothetical protein
MAVKSKLFDHSDFEAAKGKLQDEMKAASEAAEKAQKEKRAAVLAGVIQDVQTNVDRIKVELSRIRKIEKQIKAFAKKHEAACNHFEKTGNFLPIAKVLTELTGVCLCLRSLEVPTRFREMGLELPCKDDLQWEVPVE